jgi:type III pantothenate kinase
MFLAIDIGNSHTVLGIFELNNLITDYRIVSESPASQVELNEKVHSFLYNKNISPEEISSTGISSVVPALTDIYSTMIEQVFGHKPFLVNSSLDIGITIHYDNPQMLGADRICNAIAGFTKYGGPLIVVDFGTATTFDVVDANGDFLGGVIAPGIETSSISLFKRTAQLPKVALNLPNKIINTDTIPSIQAGILWSAIDSAEGMINRIQSELRQQKSAEAQVIATGGFASFVAQHTQIIEHLEPTLVLDGIRIISERIRKKDV